MVPKNFCDSRNVLDIQFENTSNSSFNVPSERFFDKVFKTGPTVVLIIVNLSPKLSTYWWDTLYKVVK